MVDLTYPRHVHQHGGVYRICEDAETYTQALDDGWVDHPLLEWGQPDTYREWDGTPLAEPVPVETAEEGSPLPKRRGRPPKSKETA